MRGALVAGALLAFGLSFDEIIVTTFTAGAGEQTLPIWIFTNFSRPNQLPIVNVVAVLVILISIIPVYLAYRLTQDEDGATGDGRGAVAAEPGSPGVRSLSAHRAASPGSLLQARSRGRDVESAWTECGDRNDGHGARDPL